MVDDSGIIIRKFKLGDEANYIDLHREVFGSQTTKDLWKWKYLDNPIGKHYIYVAEKDGKLVGQIGAIPVYFKVDGELVLATQTLDILINEKFRKSGIFFRLERAARDEAIHDGVKFTYGIAIKTTLRIAQRTLGFVKNSQVNNFVKVYNAIPFFQKRIASKPLGWAVGSVSNLFFRIKSVFVSADRTAQVIEINDIYNESEFQDENKANDKRKSIDSIHSKDLNSIESPESVSMINAELTNYLSGIRLSSIAVDRSPAYLRWRYLDCPVKNYNMFVLKEKGEITGYCVLSVNHNDRNYGHIDDIVYTGCNKRALNAMFKVIDDYFYKHKVSTATCWLNGNDLTSSCATSSGFMKKDINNYLIVRSYTDSISNEQLADRGNWYIAEGDSDYYII